MSMVTPVGADQAVTLAVLHAGCFPAPESWSANVIALQLGAPGGFGFADSRGGMILCRAIADEAEVLTLAVDPAVRRMRIGTGLLRAAMRRSAEQGVRRMFLEVSVENPAAVALYAALGFVTVGRRRRYYADGTDALVMRASLGNPTDSAP